MKTLDKCPSTLQPGFNGYSPIAVRLLFDGTIVSPMIDIDLESEQGQKTAQENQSNLSISGAQEKFSAVVDHGVLRLAKSSEQGTHILKPAPDNHRLIGRKQLPANEHLTMQIAAQVYGVRTACNALCFGRNGQLIYVTRRFDVKPDLTKWQMEDFASVLGVTEQGSGENFKYQGNYAQIADAIRRIVPAWMIETERFFRLVLFNYIYANEDAHLKNFSIIITDGECRLAPAYDLINTHVHLDSGRDLALDGGLADDIEPSDAYQRTGHPCRLDFERFARRIGLPEKRFIKLLNLFATIPPETYRLIDASFLDARTKRTYKRIIQERTARFNRLSD